MSASIVTFANLGKKKNLKTSDILPAIESLLTEGELRQIVCQLNAGFHFKNTSAAIPVFVWYPLRAIEKLSGFSFSRISMEKLFDFFAAWRLKRTDVAILHGGYFLSRTARIAHQMGSLTVDLAVSAHLTTNAFLEKVELPFLGFPSYGGLYSNLERGNHMSPKFDYVITMSDFAKDSYVQSGFPTERIFVAVPDIDTSRFAPQQTSENKFRVLYMAHTTPLKGLHYLLDAWNALQLPEAELLIVGGFSDMPDALESGYEASIKNNPSIVKIQSTEFPEDQYRKASLFVFPSLTEGFGRVTLEAMASGLPVITTENAKGLVEHGKNGFVVPIRDARALKEKIEYFYHHPEIAVEMGREARRTVEQKKPFGQAVFEIYKEILAREKRSA